MDILVVSRTVFQPFDGGPLDADLAADSSLTFTPTASAVKVAVASASDSLTFAPTASATVDRHSSAASSIVFTPAAASTHAYSVSASTTLRFFPEPLAGFGFSVDATTTLRFFPEPLAGFGFNVDASSSIVFTPTTSELTTGPKRVSATTTIIFTPDGSEEFKHGILADATTTIIFTPESTERVPGPIFVSAENDLTFTATDSSGVASHHVAETELIFVAQGDVQFVPAPPQDRIVSAFDRPTIVFKQEADAAIVRQFFDEAGRYRRGDFVTIKTTLPAIPDNPPIAVVFAPDSSIIGVFELPISDNKRINFALPVQIDIRYAFGTYRVSFQFKVNGVTGTVKDAEFQVIPGGDSGGGVISLYSFDRPEARFVVAQLNSGRLVQGRNPTVGDT